jgi:hypothetical protein
MKQEKPMRSFASLSASVLIIGSSWAAFPAVAADVTLNAGPGIRWDPNTVPLKIDDVLVVNQADPNEDHGFVFVNGDAPPPCDPAPAAGTMFCEETNGGSSGYDVVIPAGQLGEFLRLKVLADLPAAGVPFQCNVHFGGMKGTLTKAP